MWKTLEALTQILAIEVNSISIMEVGMKTWNVIIITIGILCIGRGVHSQETVIEDFTIGNYTILNIHEPPKDSLHSFFPILRVTNSKLGIKWDINPSKLPYESEDCEQTYNDTITALIPPLTVFPPCIQGGLQFVGMDIATIDVLYFSAQTDDLNNSNNIIFMGYPDDNSVIRLGSIFCTSIVAISGSPSSQYVFIKYTSKDEVPQNHVAVIKIEDLSQVDFPWDMGVTNLVSGDSVVVDNCAWSGPSIISISYHFEHIVDTETQEVVVYGASVITKNLDSNNSNNAKKAITKASKKMIKP
jgi:hypothetical protein